MPIDQKEKEFIYGGFKKAPIAMFLTILCVAVAALAVGYVVMFNKFEDLNKRQYEQSEKNVERVIDILRPDLREIKENVEKAKQNIDTVNHRIK